MGTKLSSSTASYELRRQSTASLRLRRARGTLTTSACINEPKPGRGVGSAEATHTAQRPTRAGSALRAVTTRTCASMASHVEERRRCEDKARSYDPTSKRLAYRRPQARATGVVNERVTPLQTSSAAVRRARRSNPQAMPSPERRRLVRQAHAARRLGAEVHADGQEVCARKGVSQTHSGQRAARLRFNKERACRAGRLWKSPNKRAEARGRVSASRSRTTAPVRAQATQPRTHARPGARKRVNQRRPGSTARRKAARRACRQRRA